MSYPIGDAADPYLAIIHPARRRILQEIAKKPMTPSEIIKAIGVHQSLVSRYLQCLRDANLVIVGKRGRSTEYTPNSEAIDLILDDITRMKSSRRK